MSDSVDYDPFAGGDIRSSHETTEAHKELWLAAQLGHDANCSYNLSVRLDFPVVLDAQKFSRAMVQTATRHTGLRMTFSRDGAFFHVAAEPLIDFEEVARGSVDLVARLTESEAETPFDLAVGPLWRCKFVVTGTGSTVLLTIHHIAADGWSTGLILQDLANGYIDSSNGKEGAVCQFEDYARWLNSESVLGQTGADLAYWQSRFANHESSPSIPSRNERVVMHDFHCHFLSHELSEDCLALVRKFAKVNKVTLTNLLTTAFAAYLGNISGSVEVVLGIPVAGQLDSGMTDLIGHCVNTLPLKVIVNSTDTFSDVLAKAKNDMLDDFEHRKVTFGTLLKSTSTLRDRLDGPLVPIIFNVEPTDFDLNFDNIRPRISFLPRQFDNFDASFNCAVTESGLCIDVHFSTALYDKEDMQSRLLEFERFLTAVSCCENDAAVSSIPFISESHREALTQFNATDSEFGEFVSLSEMVEKYAADNPDRTAFLYRDTSISYLELDRRSNVVAAVLTAHGVASGDLVAVAVPRSLEMVLSLLGVFKTGAGYLPIDSDLPLNRIAFMLNDAGVKAIITTRDAPKFAEQSGVQPMMIEEILAGDSPDFENVAMKPDEIAYVIYTSGSTGEPKGVEVTHGSLWNLLHSLQAEPGFTESDRFIGLTTLSFDIAVLEIWLPIFLGASSVIVDRLDSQDGRTISKIVEDQGVTVVQATPSSWNLLLASNWQGSKKVKAIAGGEPLRPEFIEQILPKISELWNGYGPTEATVYTLFKKIIGEDQKIAVGRPVANVKVHIIGKTGCLLPPGIVGEICISGACLAHGYRHQTQLTSDKFQFHEGLQSLVYYTGDLGYFDSASGDIFCLGRKDDQVKLRGYRIELGEISTIFAKVFSVDQAIALFVSDNGNDYIALAYRMVDGEEVDDTNAREALREYLPEYMVPMRYIGVDKFTITPNGKIDKRATIKFMAQSQELAAGGTTTREVDEQHSDMQELVIGVMQNTLQIPILSLHDNFFDVGGHSLVAMNTVIKLGELLNIEIDLVLIFDFPVIGEFSDQVESLLIAEVSSQDSGIQREPIF